MSDPSESGPVSLPKGWVVTTVGDVIISIDAGKSPDCPDIPASSGEWGVLKVSAVQPDGFKSQENKIIVNKAWINPAYEVQDGDLLISRSNTFQLVGIVCHVRSPQPRLMLCDKTLRMRVDPRRAMTDFVFRQFQQPSARRHIEVHATGTSGSMKNISQPSIRSLKIQLPPLPQQRKIARILTTLDNVIAQTEALIAKYQAIKQGLMHDLFTRGVDATGKLRPPQSEAPELYKQSELGWIPKEWEVVRLADYLDRIEQGWSPDCESEPASAGEWGVLKTTAVVWEGFNCHENKRLPRHLPPLPQYEVHVDDVLMTRGGPNSRVGVVVHVQQTTDKLMLSDKIYRLIPRKGLIPRYLALALSSGKTQTHLSTLKTGLAESQTNISQEIVRRLWVGLPQLSEQHAICKMIDVAENVVASERRSLEAFRVGKTGLMQDLLTGKVAVKADEPEEITP